MTAQILDGKSFAKILQAEIAARVASFQKRTSVTPCLAAVLVGEDPASAVYVRNKEQACQKAGIASQLFRLPASTSSSELLDLVARLNADRAVHGILVQLPLPPSVDATAILDAVDPAKDVDGFHPENVGLLMQGRERFVPCTPLGILRLLDHYGISTIGKHVTVVGRSDIVGKPIAALLVQRGRDATVTICHSRTADLPSVTRTADILIVAIGKPRFLTEDMVQQGAVVIDVGINRLPEGLCGDVDYAGVREVASWITPVPGGVGPLTVAMLLANTLQAAELQTSHDGD